MGKDGHRRPGQCLRSEALSYAASGFLIRLSRMRTGLPSDRLGKELLGSMSAGQLQTTHLKAMTACVLREVHAPTPSSQSSRSRPPAVEAVDEACVRCCSRGATWRTNSRPQRAGHTSGASLQSGPVRCRYLIAAATPIMTDPGCEAVTPSDIPSFLRCQRAGEVGGEIGLQPRVGAADGRGRSQAVAGSGPGPPRSGGRRPRCSRRILRRRSRLGVPIAHDLRSANDDLKVEAPTTAEAAATRQLLTWLMSQSPVPSARAT